MDISQTVGFFAGMLLLALVVEPVARRLRLPFSAVLVLCGFAGSEALVAAGVDTGLRWYHFHDLILFVLLPVIIFESALTLDPRALARDWLPVVILAVPGMALSMGATAALLYFGIAHPAGFPWIAALLTGALLSATDPVAVIDLLRRTGAPERLTVLLEGESLLNDGLAIVVFALVLGIATGAGEARSTAEVAARFGEVFFGGAAVGLAVAGAARALRRVVRGSVREGVLSLVTAYLSFWVAEGLLHVSGVLAVLAAGLTLAGGRRRRIEPKGAVFQEELWAWAAYIANAVLFLLVGVTVTTGMFAERWLAMLIGIGAVLAARAGAIFGGLSLIPGGARQAVTPGQQAVVYWGGLRGAVTLALALSLPLELDYWWTVQSIAYGVVLFTLFVQAPSMPALLRGRRL